jgi:hypothetical protein
MNTYFIKPILLNIKIYDKKRKKYTNYIAQRLNSYKYTDHIYYIFLLKYQVILNAFNKNI